MTDLENFLDGIDANDDEREYYREEAKQEKMDRVMNARRCRDCGGYGNHYGNCPNS